MSNLIADILKPITDEKGPQAGLIPNETALKNNILYHILNDDGEPTLDKDGNEFKKNLKELKTKQDNMSITSPGRESGVSQSENMNFSPSENDLKIEPVRVAEPSKQISEESDQRDSISMSNVDSSPTKLSIRKEMSGFPESIKKSQNSLISASQAKNIMASRSSTVKQLPIQAVLGKKAEEDDKFFSQSEKMLKI